VITLLFGALFATFWYYKSNDLQKKARAKPSRDGEKPPPLEAKSPFYAGGTEVNMDTIFKGSALAEAYELEGGDRGVKMGTIKDPLNMPGLYSGIEDAPTMPEPPAEGEYWVHDDARTNPSNAP